jgi:iron complex outermembrane receptor protein
MNKLLYIILGALLCLQANSQNVLTGVVKGENGSLLPGAIVSISDLNKVVVTQEDGSYTLADIPNGKWQVQYSFIGYQSHSEAILFDGYLKVVDIQLIPSSIETQEVVVTGGFNAAQHENAVKIESLKLSTAGNKISQSLSEVLTQVPGVDMISKGSGVSKPVIRGLAMNDILVLNNGVRFENYQYSNHHPLGIDEDGIETVEVIKGPASLLYGSDAIGGVINFIKEKPAVAQSINGDYNIKYFSNSRGLSESFGVKGAGKQLFGSVRLSHQTHADYLMGGGNYLPNSRFNEQSVKTNLGFNGKKGVYKLFYDYSQQRLGMAEEEAIEATTSRGRATNQFYQELKTHLLSSQNKLYLGSMKLDLNAAYQNTALMHVGEANVYEIEMGLSTLTGEARLYLPSGEKSEYIVGVQGMHQENSNLNHRETILLPNATTNSLSAFGLLQHTFADKLTLQTGLRYDARTLTSKSVGDVQQIDTYRPALDKSYGSLSGSMGATYQMSEHWLVRANVASAFRTPNLAELTSNGQHEEIYEMGDASLKPEKSLEGDLSLHHHQQNVTFDVAGFYNRVNDFIFISPTGTETASGLPIYRYLQADANLYGGEAGLHFHPEALKWLHVETTWSMVIGKQLNGDYLPFIPAQKLHAGLRGEMEQLWFLKHAFAAADVHYAFEQNHPAPDESETGYYWLNDASIGGQLSLGNQLFNVECQANNIFDVKYIDHLSTLKEVNMFNPGRNFVVAVKWLF